MALLPAAQMSLRIVGNEWCFSFLPCHSDPFLLFLFRKKFHFQKSKVQTIGTCHNNESQSENYKYAMINFWIFLTTEDASTISRKHLETVEILFWSLIVDSLVLNCLSN